MQLHSAAIKRRSPLSLRLRRLLLGPARFDRLALACACALTLVLNVVLHPHGHLEYEDWFGFHAVFGFLAYLFIVGGAVQLRKIVKREEDYYDR